MFGSADYKNTVDSFYAVLKNTDRRITDQKPGEDCWSLKEIVGHLVDSASNNHQRFVRLQESDLERFPLYDGEKWIKTQKYNCFDWEILINLWYSYNRLLLHIIENIDNRSLSNEWKKENGSITLEQLINDYYGHMNWHIDHFYKRLNEIKD